MTCPRIKSVVAVDDHTLIVVFDNQDKKKYDITPLLGIEMFAPLKNPALFKAVEVDPGGFAVVWSDRIDISEYELWKNGQPIPEN